MLILKYEELFDEKINNKLNTFLNNDKLTNFPIKYVKPHINSNTIDMLDIGYNKLFKKYKNELNYINNFPIT